jgi:hypothetical protein
MTFPERAVALLKSNDTGTAYAGVISNLVAVVAHEVRRACFAKEGYGINYPLFLETGGSLEDMF